MSVLETYQIFFYKLVLICKKQILKRIYSWIFMQRWIRTIILSSNTY